MITQRKDGCGDDHGDEYGLYACHRLLAHTHPKNRGRTGVRTVLIRYSTYAGDDNA